VTAIKVIKQLGTSTESWDVAAEEAVSEADRTIDDIQGVEVEDRTATVDDGEITEYRTTVEIAFRVRDDAR
jgi:hypothetical protein